jgi:hypothetical protein
LEYTNTVSIPVKRNAHQIQFPAIPFCLTISEIKFGVSMENVVATMENPSKYHGIFLPERKYWVEFFPDLLVTHTPMVSAIIKKATTENQSIISKYTARLFRF